MKTAIFIWAALLWCMPQGRCGQEVPSEVHFKTKDNVEIYGRLQFPKETKRAVPAIILIHQGGSSSMEWLELPLWDQLLKEGFALLAYDVRGHGQSGNDGGSMDDLLQNPDRAPLDLLAAIHFLGKDPRIDASKIGIIGASMGADLACVAAALERFSVKSVVSMSPKVSAIQSLSGGEQTVSPKNAFFIASAEEQYGMRDKWAHELYKRTSGRKKVAIGKGEKHGSYILGSNKSLNQTIVAWFDSTL